MNLYEKLRVERKQMQEAGDMPMWWSTGGWQLFKERYLYAVDTPREQMWRIAITLAKHIEGHYPDWWSEEYGTKTWAEVFFDEMWSGRLSPSTPVWSNTGTDRGMPVSCSGNVMTNSIDGIYKAKREIAILTKNSFGTATYLGNLQSRGTKTDKGVKASGIVPVAAGLVNDMDYVSQGQNRRGAVATYVEITHGDAPELMSTLEEFPDGLHVGWLIEKSFIDDLNDGSEKAIDLFQNSLSAKMKTGKGYYSFIDKINGNRPQMYVDRGLKVVAPQLCNEIHLHSSEEYTYTCVLSSQNLVHWDDIKGSKATFVHLVFLDCVNSEFVMLAKGVPGLEKAVRFAEESRALGLGVCGLHTLFQKKRLPFESMEAHLLNNEIFNNLRDQSLEASKWLAQVLGEPLWCKGYGVRNTHRTTCPPTKSTALIAGGVSEGINPDPGMTYTQLTPAGEVERVNVEFLKWMKEAGVYTKEHEQEIIDAGGSVQALDWVPDDIKLVFKIAFEIDQRAILRLGSQRQRRLCQGQSLNLWFAADEEEEYIAEIVSEGFQDPWCFGLYYFYSKAGIVASKGECMACQ
jgi:ribonucleoside-diphosphate reductase alpha chain